MRACTCQVSAAANAAGFGGGPIFVPLFHALVGFSLQASAGMSQSVITGGAVASVLVNMWQRHPFLAGEGLIDMEICLVFTPMLIIGINSGVYLNRMFPNYLITILLVLIIAYLAYKALTRGVIMMRKERRNKAAAAALTITSAAGTVARGSKNAGGGKAPQGGGGGGGAGGGGGEAQQQQGVSRQTSHTFERVSLSARSASLTPQPAAPASIGARRTSDGGVDTAPTSSSPFSAAAAPPLLVDEYADHALDDLIHVATVQLGRRDSKLRRQGSAASVDDMAAGGDGGGVLPPLHDVEAPELASGGEHKAGAESAALAGRVVLGGVAAAGTEAPAAAVSAASVKISAAGTADAPAATGSAAGKAAQQLPAAAAGAPPQKTTATTAVYCARCPRPQLQPLPTLLLAALWAVFLVIQYLRTEQPSLCTPGAWGLYGAQIALMVIAGALGAWFVIRRHKNDPAVKSGAQR